MNSEKKVLPVTVLGHDVLRQKAVRVELNDEIMDLCDAMLDAMYKYDGIGLAAPQVAESRRVVVIDIPEPDKDKIELSPGELELLPKMPMALINPEVTPVTDETDVMEEGCLSVPDINGRVERPTRVMLHSQIISFENGEEETVALECGGLLARCLQHEVDHLDGILFIDRMTLPNRVKLKSKLVKLKRVYKKKKFLRYS